MKDFPHILCALPPLIWIGLFGSLARHPLGTPVWVAQIHRRMLFLVRKHRYSVRCVGHVGILTGHHRPASVDHRHNQVQRAAFRSHEVRF
jgi:hypothetical protein